MRAKLKMTIAFANLSSALRSREWGRGTLAGGASCAGNTKPNSVRNAQNACTTPLPSTRSGRMPGREAGIYTAKALAQRVLHKVCTAAACADAKRSTCGIYSKTSDWAGHNRYLIPLGSAQSPRRLRPRGAKVSHLRGRAAAISVAAVLGLLLFASPALANLIAHGDLFVTFNGAISPTALPRHALAPVSVSVSGTVRTPPGAKPPPLQEIEIALNRNGVLDTAGLPICHLSQLEGTSSAQALRACRDALVGEGSYLAKASFPEQATFPAQGRILAFNGLSEGTTVILAHVYGTNPAPSTGVITFYVHRPRRGAYGTVLNANLPTSLQGYGYLKHIALRLHRSFTYRGQRYSYLSAACAVPAGFPSASFDFAHASMRFEGGVTLASTIVRSCRVRR